MQLLLIRHARPQTAAADIGSEPNLSYDGNEQARRLPDALSKFSLARIVSSPHLQALQTAAPVADQLGLSVDVDERFAEYDHDPSDGAFVGRVKAAIDDVIAAGAQGDTVAVFTHGGVINAAVHGIVKTERVLSFAPDYASLTRLLVSDGGELSVASVNVTEHVWDLLYRTQWWTEEH
jgi:probable phosphoglycerate mutase